MSQTPVIEAPAVESEDVLSEEFKIRCEPALKSKIKLAAKSKRQKSAAWARDILWKAVRGLR